MINYILQVILFQVLFLAIYDFFLSKETFFTKNRWYLLCTPVLSFLIPFIKIPSFQRAVPQEYIVYLPEIFLSPEKVINESSFYQSINYVNVLFWVGISFFSILFLIKLFKIINLIRENEVLKQPDFTLILIPNQSKAFSFFNYVFLGKEITETKRVNIIEHELVSTLDHASYLGKELAKADEFLRIGTPYVQDKAQDVERVEAQSDIKSCASKKCC